MTAIPIETVRSEHHLRDVAPTALPDDLLTALPDAARTLPGGLAAAALKSTPRGPAWVLTPVRGDAVTLDAETGRPFAALTSAEAARVAAQAYKGEGRPVSAVHLAEAPAETGRTGPIWRVEFSDRERTAFYLSPETGEVVTRRSAVWRFYDFFWRLHVMDWKKGEDFNHPLDHRDHLPDPQRRPHRLHPAVDPAGPGYPRRAGGAAEAVDLAGRLTFP